jgi:hypothetical protein
MYSQVLEFFQGHCIHILFHKCSCKCGEPLIFIAFCNGQNMIQISTQKTFRLTDLYITDLRRYLVLCAGSDGS